MAHAGSSSAFSTKGGVLKFADVVLAARDVSTESRVLLRERRDARSSFGGGRGMATSNVSLLRGVSAVPATDRPVTSTSDGARSSCAAAALDSWFQRALDLIALLVDLGTLPRSLRIAAAAVMCLFCSVSNSPNPVTTPPLRCRSFFFKTVRGRRARLLTTSTPKCVDDASSELLFSASAPASSSSSNPSSMRIAFRHMEARDRTCRATRGDPSSGSRTDSTAIAGEGAGWANEASTDGLGRAALCRLGVGGSSPTPVMVSRRDPSASLGAGDARFVHVGRAQGSMYW